MTTTTRRTSRHASTRWLVVLGILLASFVVAACSSAGLAPGEPGRGDEGTIPVSSGGEALLGGDTDGEFSNITDRRIIKTGEVTVEVPDVAAALGRVRALATELGGYVGGSSSGAGGDYATLTLRIPADRFDDALARLHEFDGEVLSEATREEDVTSAIVDLDARIRNLEASEEQYLALLDRAVTIEDVLAVQTRLDDVRGQIEQFSAQVKDLAELADLSTLTVSLVPGVVQQATEDWDPGKTVSDAFAALARVGQGLVNGVIWFGIVWLPALIVLAVVVLLVLRLVPGVRRRLNPPPASTPPTTPTEPTA